jgi:hypothetical protein
VVHELVSGAQKKRKPIGPSLSPAEVERLRQQKLAALGVGVELKADNPLRRTIADAVQEFPYDLAQEDAQCVMADCAGRAEFFVFHPTTGQEVAHVCLNCLDEAVDGASSLPAYHERMAAVLEDDSESFGEVYSHLCQLPRTRTKEHANSERRAREY